jgi:chromosome partitioning protein
MVQTAIRAATLVVVPARPGFLDLAAVRETVKTASDFNKPYAVVLNACPVKRGMKEAPAVANARAWLEKNKIPVWSGQVSQRAGFVLSLSKGACAGEDDARSLGAAEITKLWSAVEKSVEAVNAARAAAVRAA